MDPVGEDQDTLFSFWMVPVEDSQSSSSKRGIFLPVLYFLMSLRFLTTISTQTEFFSLTKNSDS